MMRYVWNNASIETDVHFNSDVSLFGITYILSEGTLIIWVTQT